MKPIPVIAVFDVGKTNKKLFLFDEDYQIVFERAARFTELEDEDGFPCENLHSLERSVFDALKEVAALDQFILKAVNFAAYGASLVYLDEAGQPISPLYNYLKPYPELLEKEFYDTYGGKQNFSLQTASPALGSLNSGLQFFRIKKQQPTLFAAIKRALHLPQYLSFLVTGQSSSDLTSIGCHTALWDFSRGDYHQWVYREGLDAKLAPICPCDTVIEIDGIKTGIGLHDSSAALIPYLQTFTEPFVLLSTGTWSISLNPFNQSVLTTQELENDCLNYFQYSGKPVKASRLFLGPLYEDGLKQLAHRFDGDPYTYRNILFDPQIAQQLAENTTEANDSDLLAYYRLLHNLVAQQKKSTDLVLNDSPIKQIFVDGGFSQNEVFMHLLAAAYPHLKVFAASVPQSTALGAALAIHGHWNRKPLPGSLISLKVYSA